MVNKIQLLVPPKQVGISCGAIDVCDECIEPDGFRSSSGVYCIVGSGVEGGCAGKVIQAEVQAYAREQQVANFRVRLVASDAFVELHKDQLGDAQIEAASELAGNELGNECQRALAGSAEFEDVEAVVVSFHNGREGTTFAKRGDITSHAHGSEHCSRFYEDGG